jgi:uncharacterized membrane protein YhfC
MNILYVTYLINGILMVAMPLGLAIYLTRTWKLPWRFWLVGAAVFILSQVGHIPFNAGLTALFQKNILPHPPEAWKNLFNAVVLGLSAGLFEELSRYAMFRWWLKDARSWRKGVLAGAGHGGAEAIILGLLVLFTYIQMIALRDPAVVAALPAAQAGAIKAQVAAYWSAPWYSTLLGALERSFTIPLQITFAVIVLQAFVRKQSFWVWIAVLFHALVDGVLVFVAPTVGIYWIEVFAAGFAVLGLIVIFSLRKPEPVDPESA